MRSINKKSLSLGIIPSLLISISSSGLADSNTQSQTEKLPIHGNIAVSYSSNFHDEGEYDNERSVSWRAQVRYDLDKKRSVRLYGGGYRNLDSNPGDYWTNPFLRYNVKRAYTWEDSFKLGYRVDVFIPVSRSSRRQDLNTTLRLGLPMSYDVTSKVSLSYQPRLSKNFHQYKQAGGQNLKDWGLQHILDMDFSPNDNWNLWFSGIWGHAWDYNGNKRDDTWEHSEGVTYSYDSYEVSLYHSNSGIFFDPERGNDGSISFVDDDNSTWNVEFLYSY